MLTAEELQTIVELMEEHVKACELYSCPQEKAETLQLIVRLKEENTPGDHRDYDFDRDW